MKHLIIGLDPRDIVKVRDVLHKALFLGDSGGAGAGIDWAEAESRILGVKTGDYNAFKSMLLQDPHVEARSG